MADGPRGLCGLSARCRVALDFNLVSDCVTIRQFSLVVHNALAQMSSLNSALLSCVLSMADGVSGVYLCRAMQLAVEDGSRVSAHAPIHPRWLVAARVQAVQLCFQNVLNNCVL